MGTNDTRDLMGMAALVTGASRGLGRALAAELAQRGAQVAMVARGETALAEAAGAIRALGGDVHPIVGDVADKDAIYRIVGLAQDRVGAIDVLVNNASALGPELSTLACEDLEGADAPSRRPRHRGRHHRGATLEAAARRGC